MLGIEHDGVPALAINSQEQRVIPYDDKNGFDVHNIRKWLDKFIKGELRAKVEGFGEIVDYDLKYSLYSTV